VLRNVTQNPTGSWTEIEFIGLHKLKGEDGGSSEKTDDVLIDMSSLTPTSLHSLNDFFNVNKNSEINAASPSSSSVSQGTVPSGLLGSMFNTFTKPSTDKKPILEDQFTADQTPPLTEIGSSQTTNHPPVTETAGDASIFSISSAPRSLFPSISILVLLMFVALVVFRLYPGY